MRRLLSSAPAQPCLGKKLARPKKAVDVCANQPRIVIIGAGMAGLSVAHTLTLNGINNYTIVEAKGRVGGRIHSCWLGDTVGELGAQWISGGNATNPLFNLACLEGLIPATIPRKEPKSFKEWVFLTNEGRAIESFVSEEACQIFQKIRHEAMSTFNISSSPTTQTPLEEFFVVNEKRTLESVDEGRTIDAASVLSTMRKTVSARWGTDLKKIPLEKYGCFIENPGRPVRIPQGFAAIMSPLLKEIPGGTLKVCKAVRQVIWGLSKPRAKVMCCDGEELPADYVVVTLPLGVLKAQHREMFHPMLPPEKQAAIEHIGVGHINKIFLQYETPFWAKGKGFIKFCWTAEECAKRDCWVKSVSTLEEVPESKNTLVLTVPGKDASEIECYPEDALADTLTVVLRKFTGDPTIPYPSHLLRTTWSGDPYTRGANSFMGETTKISHQCELASPLPGVCQPGAPIVLFAGEATIPGLFSTVQGARMSGIREAERIVSLTKRYNGPPIDPPLISQ